MKRTPIILLAVIGLLLAGCGDPDTVETAADRLASGAGTPASDGDDTVEGGAASGTLRSAVLGRALDRAEAMSSARFEATITVGGQAGGDLPGAFTMTLAGAFDREADASEITMDVGDLLSAATAGEADGAEAMAELFAGLLDEPLRMITIGDTSWVKWGLLAMFGVDDAWLESDAAGSSMAADFGVGGGTDSPISLLEGLAEAEADVEIVGREDVRGVTTTHHRASLDVAALAERMSDEQRAAFEVELGASTEARYLLDLWIDDDDLLHRFELAVDERGAADGAQVGEVGGLAVVYDLWDHGVDQGIAPPPADEVVTEAELGFSLEDLGALAG